jgi:two-component system chemotaxis response regulator CheY
MNPPTLLVADDEPMMRLLLSQTLGAQGFNVLLAENGIQAFEMVNQNEVTLILTDINMPKLNGLKLVENLQASTHKNIPVILMTGDADHLKESELKGATVIRKPFRRRELVELIQSILAPAAR